MQEVITGTGSFAKLASLLKEEAAKRILLVAGQHFTTEEAFEYLTSSVNIPLQILHPPAGLLQVNAIPAINEPVTFIAVGGGKTIDFAKGIIHQSGKKVRFIAAPTTAGSGSEATPFAVFYSAKEKVSFDHPDLLPQTVFLDAALLKNLSTAQKAISGADALAQCIESVWNVNSNQTSEKHALDGLGVLWNNLPAFVCSNDHDLASQVLLASHLSGKAIAVTRTTGPHALSYYLTAKHNVPHGIAVALLLPLFFLYNNVPAAEAQLQKLYQTLQVSSAEGAFESSRRFFSGIGLPTGFKDANLESVNIDQLLNSVNRERFANNPVPFDFDKLKTLIQRYLL
jgi:alcohol dehydrogenase class IV